MIDQRVPASETFDLWSLRQASVVCVLTVLVLLFFRYLLLTSGLDERQLGWYYYLVIGACIGLGCARPHIGTMTAFALVPINFGLAVPMMFTSAPSSFILIGVFLRILWESVSARRLPNIPALPIVVCLPLLATVTLSFLMSLGRDPTFQVDWRLRLSEVLGLTLLFLFIFAPAVLGWGRREVGRAAAALGVGIAAAALLGLLGSVETAICLTEPDSSSLFNMRFYRVIGGQSDPNLYGTTLAASMPIAYWALTRSRLGGPISLAIALALIATPVVFSASRTAVATGIIALLLSAGTTVLVSGFRQLPVFIPAALILLSSTMLWQHTPCVFDRSPDIPYYSERNSAAEYFNRVLKSLPDHKRRAADLAMVQEQNLEAEFSRLRSDPEWVRTVNVPTTDRPSQWPMPSTPAEEFVTESIKVLGNAIALDNARINLWTHAASVGLHRPITGWGPGNLAAMTPRGWRAHNSVLTLFAELGMPGATAYIFPVLLLFVITLIGGRRAMMESGASAPYLLAGLLVIYIGSLAQDIYRAELLWALVGLTTVWLMAALRKDRNAARRRTQSSKGTIGLTTEAEHAVR